MKKVYLDYNATTPVRKEVLEEMLPYFSEKFGNPSSLHRFGQETRKVIEDVRKKIADFLNADPLEIYFTSGGTESNNLAIKGVVFESKFEKPHVITTKIEHHAVLEVCKWLEERNFIELTLLDVDKFGMVNPDDVIKNIKENTVLVSIMHANNEVGTIQPLKEIGEKLQIVNSERIKKGVPEVYFHTDAVQTVGKIDIDVNKLKLHLLSLSAHKFYGPKGIGAIYIRKGTRITSLIQGGHHEREIRAGTENLPGIVGLGKAIEVAKEKMYEEEERVKKLRDKLKSLITENISDVLILGHPEKTLPNTLSVLFKYVEGEAVVLQLDMEGIATSSGSACSSGSGEPSHVLRAMNVPQDLIRGAVRFSLGKDNTEDDIIYTFEKLKDVIKKLRDISPLYKKNV